MSVLLMDTDKWSCMLYEWSAPYIDGIYGWYRWRENSWFRLMDRVPVPVDGLAEGNSFQRNAKLKESLSQHWQKYPESRLELAAFYVKDWGGVRALRDENLNYYVSLSAADFGRLGSNRVASWSKVACLHDVNTYAIFDARVAASLFSLNKKFGLSGRVPFPVLPSRNRTISEAGAPMRKNALRRGGVEGFYENYLQILQNVASRFGVKIYVLEMLLFSKAEALVREVYLNTIRA